MLTLGSIWMLCFLSVGGRKFADRRDLPEVHVNSEKGSDSLQCGRSSSPCKTLSKGVEQVAGYGKVYVSGTHYINSTIKIRKNMEIVGINGTRLMRQRGARVEHVFDVSIVGFRYIFSKTGPHVSFTLLTARGIGLVDVTTSVTIEISRCMFRDPAYALISCGKAWLKTGLSIGKPTSIKGCYHYLAPCIQKRYNSVSRFTLSIERSMFVNTLPLKIYDCPGRFSRMRRKCIIRFSIRDSAFNRTKQWMILYSQKSAIENTIFDKYDGFILKDAVGQVEIRKCKFVNGSVEISLSGDIATVEDSLIKSVSSKLNVFRIFMSESIIIKNCLISNNTTPLSPFRLGLSTNIAITNLTCRFNIVQKNSGGCLFLYKVRRFVIHNSTFIENSAFLNGGAIYAPSKGDTGVIFAIGRYEVVKCFFRGNSAKTGGSLYWTGLETIIKNCTFKGNSASSDGGAVYLKVERDLHKSAIITYMEECIFSRNRARHGGSVYISTGYTKGRHDIENCTFFWNEAIKDGGAMVTKGKGSTTHSVAIIHSKFLSCSAGNQGGAAVITQVDTALLQNCILVANIASVSSGALLISTAGSNSKGIINQTSFINCSAPSIYMRGKKGIVQNTLIQGYGKSDLAQMQCETKSALMLSNVTMEILRLEVSRDTSNAVHLSSSSLSIHSSLRLICPAGLNSIEDHSLKDGYTSLKLKCIPCSYAYYSIKKISYLVEELPLKKEGKPSSGMVTQKCLKCEAGGICDVEVKAVDNYWGYVDGDKVFFKVCPVGFCCSSDTRPCVSYNTCAPGRKGILCGTCDVGYKQSFVSDGCIRMDHVRCDQGVFFVYLLLYTICHTLLFTIITNAKDILMAVKNSIASRRKKMNVVIDEEDQAEKCVHDETEFNEDDGQGFSIAAYVQVTVLHFQVASLMKVKFQDRANTRSTDDGVSDSISDILNFRFTIYQKVCPSDTLTLPEKEMILFGLKMATFFTLLLFGLSYSVLKSLRCRICRQRQKKTTVVEEAPLDTIEMTQCNQKACPKSHGALTLVHRLEMTSIKFLKMYYTPVTKASLQMIHCVPILGSYHLFVFGDHVCYSPWQLCIIFVLLPGILLFPICFELAIRMLKKRQINSTMFTAATVCPYLGIFLYFWKRKYSTNPNVSVLSPDEKEFVTAVLETEEELFHEDKGSLGWQIIQLYRTFLLNLLSIYLTNPVFRALATIPVLLMFTIHDRNRQPYKNEYLNNLQLLSSRCLLLISVCNFVPSVSFMVDITSTLHIYQAAKILSILELMLYAVVPLSLPVWKIWVMLKKRRTEKKQK